MFCGVTRSETHFVVSAHECTLSSAKSAPGSHTKRLKPTRSGWHEVRRRTVIFAKLCQRSGGVPPTEWKIAERELRK
jgi:hypothetical protein